MNPKLNKKVKKYLDSYFRDTKTNSPEHQEAVMLIMKGALTDANFHSEAKQLDKYFPKASKKYIGTPMEGVIESKGTEISKMAKYDGHDIIDAFAFYLSMSIGGSFGNRLMSLKESLDESLVEEGEKLDEKNVPTDSSKWSYYKAQAKKKFDVYPSAYANGWAAKQYKKAGGGWKKESVNEAASRTAMEIGGLTGMNKDAIQKFVDDNNLDIEKVYQFVKKGKLADRMKLVSAIAGKPNNPVQKKMVKQFGESVNEILVIVDKFDEKRQTYGKLYYKDGGKKPGDGDISKVKKELDKLRLNPKRKDLTIVSVGRNSKMYAVDESVNEGYGEFIKAKNLTDIVTLSKKKKNAVFYVTDDNNSRIGAFYLKNGKFAKATSANPNYDLQNNKTKLRDRSDVIYKYKVDESVVNESELKEFKHKVGSETIQFKVSPYRTGISLIAASGNDLDKLQDVMGSEDEVKGEIRKSLEKKLRIPIEIDRDYEGAGFGFKIDLYALAKMVK